MYRHATLWPKAFALRPKAAFWRRVGRQAMACPYNDHGEAIFGGVSMGLRPTQGCENHPWRAPRVGGGPVLSTRGCIPAFAGMTGMEWFSGGALEPKNGAG